MTAIRLRPKRASLVKLAGLGRLAIIVHSAIVHTVLGEGVRVFKTKWFARFARRERIADRSLTEAIERAERGLVDADLIKQRIARAGQGRSGGYRTLIAYHAGGRAVFLYATRVSERTSPTTSC